MARAADQFVDIAEALGISKTQAHNAAKRAFNKLLAELVDGNRDMTMLDAVVELMKIYELDAYAIKTMLNQKNKATISKELADTYKLRELKKISDHKYNKIVKILERRRR